ncbi:MAG TPA: acetamidase/formamidase family protein [Nitrolancea sp.]|jgi:amidase|nr:acetamidase/formamidase family protein [Nitrolancea sp.]
MHQIRAGRTTFAFRPDAEPVLRIEPGETVQFETSPEPVERLFAAGEKWMDALDIAAINAVTGPVYVEGAEPGDAIAVEILEIQPGDWGWNAFIPGFGLLDGHLPGPMLRRVPIRDGRVMISERLTLPVEPMIGCLGLAPASGETSTLMPPFPWGGNYDMVEVKPGNTILFPVQVPGGLFSLGDLHAGMGRAEATFVSIECPGTATVRLGLRKGLSLPTPRIEAPDRVFTIGLCDGVDFHCARVQAVALMFDYLTTERGLSAEDAHVIISACVDVDFGGPTAAVVLASVPLSVLG